MEKMEKIVTMDKSGRIVIPLRIRQKFNTNRFELNANEDKIELTPIKSIESLFGKVPELDIGKIKKEHKEESEKDRLDGKYHS